MVRNSVLEEILALFAECHFADCIERPRELCEGLHGICNKLGSGSCLNSNLAESTVTDAATEEVVLFLSLLVDYMKSFAENYKKSTSVHNIKICGFDWLSELSSISCLEISNPSSGTWIWQYFANSPSYLFLSNTLEMIMVCVREADMIPKHCSDNDLLVSNYLSRAICINMLIVAVPTHFSGIDLNAPKAHALLCRLCRMGKQLISAGHFVIALDYVLISLHFVARIAPQSLIVWHSEFHDFKCLEPLLTMYHEDILPALFATIHVFSNNCLNNSAVVSLLNDLALWLQSTNEPSIVNQFVRLLTIGTPNVLSLVNQVLPANSASSFVWLCIKIAVPLRYRIHPACIHVLVCTYINILEKDTRSQPNVCVLAEIFSSYFEDSNEFEENGLNYQDVAFIIRMFSRVVHRSRIACRFRCAMLHSLICPYLISIQMVSTPQIALALELSSSFIRLVGDLTEPEAIQAASDTLPSLSKILLNAPISAGSITSVIDAFADCLAPCASYVWPSYLTFCDIGTNSNSFLLESLVINFLQLILRCVRAEPSVTHSDLRVIAWTALWQVLAHPLSVNWISQPFLHTGTGDSLLQSLTKAAEDQLANAVGTSIGLHASLIGVLCEIYRETQKSRLDNIPLDCNNLDVLERLILFSVSEACGRHNEISKPPEVFEKPKVRTLSPPTSNYLNEEKKMCICEDSQVEKHIDLFFFIFHRFMRICDLGKPDHPHTLKRFLREVLKFRRRDLMYYFPVNNNQIRKWLSDVVSDALELLRTQQPQSEDIDHSVSDLLLEFLEFFCVGNESDSLPVLFQTTPVQLRSLLQLAIGNNSRKLKVILIFFAYFQLRIVRLLVKWSSRADPLEPEHFLAWPRHLNFLLPASLHQSQIVDPNNASVFKNFAFARSSIPLDQWQFDPAQPYPQTLISTIWPLSIEQHLINDDRQPFDIMNSTATLNSDSSGLAVAMWYKLEVPADYESTFDVNIPLSKSTLVNLALQGEMLHLFTLEESPTFLRSPKPTSSMHLIEHAHSPQPRTIPLLSCWSIEVWLVPSSRGVYTRIRRKCNIGKQHFIPNHSACNSSEVLLFGDAYLSDALDSNFWGHMLFSIHWNKNSKANLTGTVAITTNASTYTESAIELSPLVSSSAPNRDLVVNFVHSRRFTTNLCSLSLWIGHVNAALDVLKNATSRGPCLFTNGLLLFTGDILSKMPVKSTEGSRAQLRELALYLALCGPSWNGTLPCSSRDAWPTLSARGRCYLNSLLPRLRLQELSNLFMRGQSILDAVEQFRSGTAMWVHTLRRLINQNLLVSTGYPSLASVNWTVRLPSKNHLSSSAPVFYSGLNSIFDKKMKSSSCFQVASKLWMVDPTSNCDVEVTAQNTNTLTKCSVDATIAPIGGVDAAFFLAGAVACAPEVDTEAVADSLDFILTLTRHSVVAAEVFYRPLSEELIPRCSADAFDRLHITNYGLCLLTSLINRLCLRRVNLTFQEVFTKHAYVNVVDEGIRLLIDPELIVCQMMFSSLESLPAVLSVLGDCLANANRSHDQILARNIASVDEARLIEAAVTSFRVSFPTSSDNDINRAFEETSVSLSRLLSQRLAVQPLPTALLTFLLRTLTSIDPDLYHGAAARAFATKARETPLGVDLASLTRSRLQFLQFVAAHAFVATSCKRDENVPNAETFHLSADESSEEGTEQHLSPSPLDPTSSTPLIPMQPSFTLVGASDAEAATLARFRENILSGGDQSDSSLSSTLFGSCNSLWEFGSLDLAEGERGKGCRSCASLTRYHSLPDISIPMVESSSFASQPVTEASILSSGDEASSSENQYYPTTADPDTPTISPLRLSQRHHLAALTLSALAQFWQTAATKSDAATERKTDLSVPPFWLIYHLCCHPCVKFREHALSLYIALLSMHPDRKVCYSPDTDRVLAVQLLSDTSSITFRYCSSVTETQCAARCVLDPGDRSLVPLAHVALTSQSLLAYACSIVNSVVNSKSNQVNAFKYSSSIEDGIVVPTPIALSIVASSLVDIEIFQQMYNEKSAEEALLAEVTNRGVDCLDSLSNFFSCAKADLDVLISLCNPFSLYILLEIAFFLQSTCSPTGDINVYTERFHEIGTLISRLLGSIISKVKDRITFADVKAIIFHLRFGSDSVDEMDRPASSRTCIVREVLLRVLLSSVGRILKELNGDAYNSESLLSQLQWTVVVVEDTLLFKESASPLESLTTDPSSLSCPQSSMIHLLEKAIITLFVNSASHAMRNTEDAIWSILSSSLMRLLHAWCEVLLETLTISMTGLWLLTLLSQEPHIIGDKAVSCCPNIIMDLRNNLQMLEAVFSIKSRGSEELQCSQGTSGSTCRSDCVGDRGDTARRKIDYYRVSNAVQILLEWVEKLCSNFGCISRKSSQHSIPSPLLSPPETNLCSQLHVDQFDWLSPLREVNEAGQRHWSMLVSQHRHILDVLAPFYWMQLGGAMGHECSVFCIEALKPAFSHMDTFEDESRQRCRRRPVFIWMDDRFVRPTSVRALGQYLKSHQLSPLMMHQSTYTPARGLAKKRCLLTPQIQFPPSCQALFPPPVALSDRCLGVWSCRLVGISDSLPLDGDLTLDANWIRLVINDKELPQSPMRNRNCSGALMHGLGDDGGQKEVLTCPLHAIARVEERRFELRDLALELFFERAYNMPPIMIAFRTNKERDYFIRSLMETCGSLCTRPLGEWWRLATGRRMSVLGQATSVRSNRGPRLSLRDLCDVLVAPFPTPFVGPASRARLLDAQVAWLRGQISNFDYIMVLNTAAGRTYNDVTQYPIFPWILADYESEVLDLEKTSSSFRRLDRPISVQTESRVMAVSRHYEEMKAQQSEIDVVGGEEQRTLLCPVFHYPSFCSNEAIILHLLFRLIPYAFRLIQFQDGNFDDPNRLFHSVASEWSLTTSSTAFAKELVPEFYFRPDMFVNCENFELGTRHDGEIVDSVKLPPWAKGDPRLFVLVNRAALESPYVTAHIPEWIDLVFGYKQTGRWGERAVNLYHPFTYFGAIDVDNIEDPLRRAAVQSMIRNYGQAPRQLFPNHPHPRRTTSFITVKTSTDSRRYSDFFNLSRLTRYILSRQQAALLPRKTEDNEEFQPLQSVAESPIAMVKSFSAEEEEGPWLSSGVSVATSIVPLTAGAPLDTVKGLRWGNWAGSPLLEPLGISWYANLQGGSRFYRLRSHSFNQPYASRTILVTDSFASLFLLHLPSHPLLLVKISLLCGVIRIAARSFFDGVELYSTTMPVSFVEPVSVFIAAPSVVAKPLSRDTQIHLFVGTSFGGLYARTLSSRELLCGFISDDNDERQLCQHLSVSPENLFDSDDLIGGCAKVRASLSNHKHGLIASGDARGRVAIWDLASTAFIALLEMDESSGVFEGLEPDLLDPTKSGLDCSRQTVGRAVAEFLTFKLRRGSRQTPIRLFAGCQVGCILIGGPNGCLTWLSSWTLNTISVMRLDQPSPCPVVALSFVPPPATLTRPTDRNHTNAALYIVDSEGWIYFLESGAKAPSRQLRIRLPYGSFPTPGMHQHQGSNFLYLPGIWL
ncbi:hypothetical protein TcWFU_001518 [Taenia crassiceps]|uniref:Lysosomal-trafficking regulator n=1 Tax=Taenia crassiceps TaxID=6207 RepID=A0ABR4QC96_9CEST